MRNAVYIENLPAHLGRGELERLLRPYGLVRDVLLATDPDMFRRHAGLAVAAMATPVQARRRCGRWMARRTTGARCGRGRRCRWTWGG